MSTDSKVATTTWNRGFKREWDIVGELVSKDFKLKYRRSVLGVLWSVLNPLLMMIVMTIVFSNFFRANLDAYLFASYPVYLILGNITFSLVSDSTTSGMVSIISAAPLLKKVKIQRMVFPIQKVLFALVNFAFSLIAVALVMVQQQVPITWHVVWIPLLLIYVMLFCIGLALLLSTIAVFFRDMIHLWSVFMTAWMYLTPIFYSVDILPAVMQKVIFFNPLYQFINYFRVVILNAASPSLGHNLICLAMALAFLVIGVLVFKRHEHKFILYI